MTQHLSTLEPLEIENARISVEDTTVRFAGALSLRSPSDTLTPYLKQVHEAATKQQGLRELNVDLSELHFMNSSSIRALVDWVNWIQAEPEAKRYVLHFVTDPQVTWQRTTLGAIRALGEDCVTVSQKGGSDASRNHDNV